MFWSPRKSGQKGALGSTTSSDQSLFLGFDVGIYRNTGCRILANSLSSIEDVVLPLMSRDRNSTGEIYG